MNVYDFDKTIYKGDSTVDFYLYTLKRSPSVILCLPRQIWGIILYLFKRIDKTKMKEYFYCFLTRIDAEKLVECFWSRNSHRIYDWYLKQKREDDIIISASPEFLLMPICTKLGITRLLASRVDKSTGCYDGKNCRGEEKVRRLRESYGNVMVEEFYSDSLSDQPLADVSNKAFLIVKGKITPWK